MKRYLNSIKIDTKEEADRLMLVCELAKVNLTANLRRNDNLVEFIDRLRANADLIHGGF